LKVITTSWDLFNELGGGNYCQGACTANVEYEYGGHYYNDTPAFPKIEFK